MPQLYVCILMDSSLYYRIFLLCIMVHGLTTTVIRGFLQPQKVSVLDLTVIISIKFIHDK